MSYNAFDATSTAVLIVDLQNDFLHPKGAYGRSGTSSPEIAALPSRIKPLLDTCLLYTSPSPRDGLLSRMPSSA